MGDINSQMTMVYCIHAAPKRQTGQWHNRQATRCVVSERGSKKKRHLQLPGALAVLRKPAHARRPGVEWHNIDGLPPA